MGFFGPGFALGAFKGFEEKQEEIGEEQRENTKQFQAQIKAASVGMGDVVKKRKAFNEQVTTFAAALENDPSLKNKLKDLGPDGIRALAKSALNTRYAEGNASGSKFRVSDFIRQVQKTDPTVLEKYVPEKPSASTGKEKSQEEESTTSGLFGNFANILSPTRAGEQQRSVMRQEFAKAFPGATKEELDNAINSYGRNSGSTNDLETDTPFSVGVPLGIGENEQFAKQAQSVLQELTNNTMDLKSRKIPLEAADARLKTEEISNLLLQQKYYSVGDNRQQNADITELFDAFYNNNNLLSVYNINDIRGLLNDGNFNVTEYLKSLNKKLNIGTPAITGSATSTNKIESLNQKLESKKRD